MNVNVAEIHAEAVNAAIIAANEREAKWGDRFGSCGFAWVEIFDYEGKKIRANSKLGKALSAIGIEKNYTGYHSVWNPSKNVTQNVDIKEAGADAYAKVLRSYGFAAYAGSRLD